MIRWATLAAVLTAACANGDMPETQRDAGPMPGDATMSQPDTSTPLECGALTTCGGSCVDLMSSPRDCGACGRTCVIPNAVAGCDLGECTIAACEPGFFDVDEMTVNGCETEDACIADSPCTTACGSQGMTMCSMGDASCAPPAESCNTVDDNCNGQCDEGAIAGCRAGVHRGNGNGHIFTRDAGLVTTAPYSVERMNFFYLYDTAVEGLRPLFRCRKSDGKMLLTTDTACEGVGPRQEQLGYISTDDRCGAAPLYRMYQAASNNHFYTTSAPERDNAVNNLGYVEQASPGFIWTSL